MYVIYILFIVACLSGCQSLTLSNGDPSYTTEADQVFLNNR